MAQSKQHPLVGFMPLPEFFSDAVDMLTSLSDDWDVVNLLWTEPTAAPGVVSLRTCRQEPCQNDTTGTTHDALSLAIKRRVLAGRTVQICVNCLQGVPSSTFPILSLESQDALNSFVQSVEDIVNTYGFNGVYIDLERVNSSLNIVTAVKHLKEIYGTHFSATLRLYGDGIGAAPEDESLDVVWGLANELAGLYIFPPTSMISDTLPDAVDTLFPGGSLALNSDSSLPIGYLPVFFDVSASGSPLADAFWEDPSHVQAALSCITETQSCASGVQLKDAYPAFAGIVSRDIFDDESHGGAFRQAMVPYLASLSQNLTTPSSTTSTDTGAAMSSTVDAPHSTSTSPATSEQSHPSSRTRALQIALPVGLVVGVVALCIGFCLLRRRLGTRRRITAEAEVPHPYGVTSTQFERPIWREKLQHLGKTVPHHHIVTPSDPFAATSSSSDQPHADGQPQSATETGVATGTEEADQPEQMAALRAAMRRVGFSVHALLASLNRIEPAPSLSASRDEDSHDHSHSGSADVPPTYSEDL